MTYREHDDFIQKVSDIERMKGAFEHHGLPSSLNGATLLEIGGGNGIASGLLASNCSRAISTDIINNQARYGGEYPKLLREKFARNGYCLPLDKIDFHTADATDLPFRDGLFDFVFSINAFEHIPDPAKALQEAIRVTSPGGRIYLSFDPVWTSDTGNHFPAYAAPWEHLISSTHDFTQMMLTNGAYQEEVEGFSCALNRKPSWYYSEEFPRIASACREFRMSSWSGCANSDNINHPNRFKAAAAFERHPDDFLIRGFCIVIVK